MISFHQLQEHLREPANYNFPDEPLNGYFVFSVKHKMTVTGVRSTYAQAQRLMNLMISATPQDDTLTIVWRDKHALWYVDSHGNKHGKASE